MISVDPITPNSNHEQKIFIGREGPKIKRWTGSGVVVAAAPKVFCVQPVTVLVYDIMRTLSIAIFLSINV